MVSGRGGCESPSIRTPTRKGGVWGTRRGEELVGDLKAEFRYSPRLIFYFYVLSLECLQALSSSI